MWVIEWQCWHILADPVQLIEVITVAASVSLVFVWGASSLAYIRYHRWLVVRFKQDGLSLIMAVAG